MKTDNMNRIDNEAFIEDFCRIHGLFNYQTDIIRQMLGYNRLSKKYIVMPRHLGETATKQYMSEYRIV
jgi:hypothetical protein